VGRSVGEGVAVLVGLDGVNVSVAMLAGMAVGDGNNVGVGDAITTRAVGEGDGDDVDVGDGGDIGFEAVATDVVTMTTGRVLGTDLDFVFANVTGLVSFTVSPSAIKKPRTVNVIIATSARLARIAFCLFVMLCCQLSLAAAIASCAINPHLGQTCSNALWNRISRQVYHETPGSRKTWGCQTVGLSFV